MFDCWFTSEYVRPVSPLLLHSCTTARIMWACLPPHLIGPFSLLSYHSVFRPFLKPTHPKGKATRSQWAHTAPRQNTWTGWHDPVCFASHPSPAFPVLAITHATTHDDTHTGCGTRSGGSLEPHDRRTRADGFLLTVRQQVSGETEP